MPCIFHCCTDLSVVLHAFFITACNLDLFGVFAVISAWYKIPGSIACKVPADFGRELAPQQRKLSAPFFPTQRCCKLTALEGAFPSRP